MGLSIAMLFSQQHYVAAVDIILEKDLNLTATQDVIYEAEIEA